MRGRQNVSNPCAAPWPECTRPFSKQLECGPFYAILRWGGQIWLLKSVYRELTSWPSTSSCLQQESLPDSVHPANQGREVWDIKTANLSWIWGGLCGMGCYFFLLSINLQIIFTINQFIGESMRWSKNTLLTIFPGPKVSYWDFLLWPNQKSKTQNRFAYNSTEYTV